MTKKSTKRALLFSVLSLVVCLSMLVGTTFAWFTDSVTSAQNTIESGNLDVELYYADKVTTDANGNDTTAWAKVTSTTDIFGYDLWEPGFTKVAYFKVVNEGSLALKYKLSADVYAETAGINQADQEFFLSDYIKTAVVDVDATRDEILAMDGTNLKASFGMSAGELAADDTQVVGLALWMPTTVGNVANHNGTNVPSITFGINLLAAQDAAEIDSFGNDYDYSASYPHLNIGAPVITAATRVDLANDNITNYEVPLLTNDINDDGDFSKQGSVVIPKEAIDPAAKEIEVVVKKLEQADTSVPVPANHTSATIDVTVVGIKENNTAPIEVTVNIGAGLGNIRLYHKNVEIFDFTYNNVNGVLRFQTTSFSPFTVVYDGQEPTYSNTDLPTATVTPYTDTDDIEWGNYGQWSPTEGLEANLEAAYTFTCNQTLEQAKDNAYANWYCDFYVKLDKPLGANQIFLGGNYGSFGWVGFHNGDVTLNANEELPLLGSVTSNPWTYMDVVNYVGEFICGVGDVNDALADATFTVMLRLTNPEDETDYKNVAVITHTFTKTVNSGEELQDAINNGNENIILGGDIDLNNGGIVIP